MLEAGDGLCREDEASGAMFFVASGRDTVLAQAAGSAIRVRVFGSHTNAGELGLMLGAARSATLEVERVGQMGQLSRTDWGHPAQQSRDRRRGVRSSRPRPGGAAAVVRAPAGGHAAALFTIEAGGDPALDGAGWTAQRKDDERRSSRQREAPFRGS